jgi:hypothetical protein
MRTPAGGRWTVSLTADSEITFALYARDALALAHLTGEGLPALTPPVDGQPRLSGGQAVLAARWDAWWRDLMGSTRPAGLDGPRPIYSLHQGDSGSQTPPPACTATTHGGMPDDARPRSTPAPPNHAASCQWATSSMR